MTSTPWLRGEWDHPNTLNLRIGKSNIMPQVVCIGSATIDIKARPEGDVPIGSTSSGHVYVSTGGVALVMARNLAQLGLETYLITAIGQDYFADLILRDAQNSGVRTELVRTMSDHQTALYSALLDSAGVPKYAVFDGNIINQITPHLLSNHVELIASADLVVANTNLLSESLAYLSGICSKYNTSLYVNATSASVADRVLPILSRITFLGANNREVEAMLNLEIETPDQAIRAGNILVKEGAREVVITLGSSGVVLCSSLETSYFKAASATVVETTGAGDALCSAYLFARVNGYRVSDALKMGVVAAALTVESPQTVAPSLTVSSILNRSSQDSIDEFGVL